MARVQARNLRPMSRLSQILACVSKDGPCLDMSGPCSWTLLTTPHACIPSSNCPSHPSKSPSIEVGYWLLLFSHYFSSVYSAQDLTYMPMDWSSAIEIWAELQPGMMSLQPNHACRDKFMTSIYIESIHSNSRSYSKQNGSKDPLQSWTSITPQLIKHIVSYRPSLLHSKCDHSGFILAPL